MKVDDPALQQFHYEQVQRMLLAAFISGLIGNQGQVRFRMPQTLEDALQTAVTLHEAEAQERRKGTFYSGSGIQCEKCNKYGHTWQQCLTHFRSIETRSKATTGKQASRMQGQNLTHSARTRNTQSKAQLRCYECNKLGHYARECYKRTYKNRAYRRNLPLRSNKLEIQNAKFPNLVASVNEVPQGNE
jgi:hypothetical protein